MAFISLLIADLMLMGIGIAILNLFGFGTILILVSVVVRLIRRNKIKKGQPVYGKTILLTNIAIVVGNLGLL